MNGWESEMTLAIERVLRADRACGRLYPVEYYERLFPRYEALVRSSYASFAEVASRADTARRTAPPPSPPPPLPRRIGGYEILGEIARGSGGVVYRARQPDLERVVAVKILHGGEFAGEEELRRFRLEAQAAAALRHPNIVAIHEIGEHGGLPFFSMEYCEGPTLDVVAGGRPVEGRRAARLVRKIADAIAYAHAHGVLHRDLKPRNVIVGDGDEPRITDFGLAKRLDTDLGLTRSGSIVGTPGYMPPEQARGRAERGGPESDVYSIGAILYELLTGRPPFTGASLMDTLRHVLEDEPVPIPALNPLAPADLATIAMKCLSKEPAGRYATAGDLVRELDRYLRGEPIHARPVGAVERARRWCARNPVVASLVTAVFALLTVSLAVLTRLTVELADEKDAALTERNRAVAAEGEKTERLWAAYRTQARSSRVADLPGRRFDCLEAVRSAAAIRFDSALRDEAAAALALTDLRPRVVGRKPADRLVVALDATLGRWADTDVAGTLRIVRVEDDRTQVLEGAGTPSWLAEFSRDGRHLWSKHHRRARNEESVIRVWDLDAGRVVREEARASCAAFSPDGTRVALARPSGEVAEILLGDGSEVRRVAAPWVADRLAYSPDGRRLAASSVNHTSVEVLGGDASASLPHASSVRGIAWSPDGTEIAAACADRTVVVWRLAPVPAVRLRLPTAGIPVGVAFAPDGNHLWGFAWDGCIRLWDAADGAELAVADGATTGPWVSADGSVAGLYSDRPENVGVFDAAISDASTLLSGPAGVRTSAVHDARFSPDGRLVVTASDDGVRIWDVQGQSLVTTLAHDGAWEAQFHGDDLLVVAEGRLVARSLRLEGNTLRVGAPRVLVAARVTNAHSVVPLPASRRLAVGLAGPGADCEVVTIDPSAPTAPPQRLGTLHGTATFLAASPDGRLVAAAPFMGSQVAVWDVATAERVATLPVESHGDLAFSPDGTTILVGSPHTYRAYSTATWTEVASAERRKTTVWGESSYLGAGELVAVTLEPGVPRLLDATDLSPVVALEGAERAAATCLAASADGRLVAVPVSSSQLRLWHVGALRRELREIGLDWAGPGPADGRLVRSRERIAAFAGEASDDAVVRSAEPPPDFAGTLFTQKMRTVSGSRRVLALLWDPHRPDHPAPPRDAVERLLFGPRPSVADWFAENSGRRLTLASAGVLGWWDAEKPPEHYWTANERTDPDDRDGDGWIHGHAEKWAEILRHAEAEFDFARFDADRDGVLSPEELGILVVIPQRQPFGTNRPPVCREVPAPEPLVVDGVRIPVLAEWYVGDPPNLGAPAHELAHLFLGAPDLYQSGTTTAPGAYSIMDRTYTATHLDPFAKLKLGWVGWDAASEGTWDLPAVETSGRVRILWDPARGPGEYFLLENRWRGASYDAGAGPAGAGLPQDGLAVWHVIEDPAVFARHGTAGRPGEWGRRGIRLVRANGGTPIDDGNALFAHAGSAVPLRWADGTPAPFELTVLTDAGPTMRVSVRRR
jgi:M6 family metalloprotease-like protein